MNIDEIIITTFPGIRLTGWTDDEGFDMVTVGIPGTEVSALYVTDWEHLELMLDAANGYIAPRPYDSLYVMLDAHMERTAA